MDCTEEQIASMKNLQESEALALLQLPKGECILCHDEVILVVVAGCIETGVLNPRVTLNGNTEEGCVCMTPFACASCAQKYVRQQHRMQRPLTCMQCQKPCDFYKDMSKNRKISRS